MPLQSVEIPDAISEKSPWQENSLLNECNSILASFGFTFVEYGLRDGDYCLQLVNLHTFYPTDFSTRSHERVQYILFDVGQAEYLPNQDEPVNWIVYSPDNLIHLIAELRENEKTYTSFFTEMESTAGTFYDFVHANALSCTSIYLPQTPSPEQSELYGLPQHDFLLKSSIGELGVSLVTSMQDTATNYSLVHAVTIVPNDFTDEARAFAVELTKRRLVESGELPPTATVWAIDRYAVDYWMKLSTAFYHEEETLEVQEELEQLEESEDSVECDLEAMRGHVYEYLVNALEHTIYSVEKISKGQSWLVDGEDPTPDFRIVYKDSSVRRKDPASLAVWGWKGGSTSPSADRALTAYDTVCGFVLVPPFESMPLRIRKAVSRQAALWLKTKATVAPNAQILTVDQDLLSRWQELESPFIEPERIPSLFAERTSKEQADYGSTIWRQRDEPPLVQVEWWEPKIGGQIGSPQLMVKSRWDDLYTDAMLIDTGGWMFSQWKGAGIIDNPRPNDGLMRFLKQRMFRPVTRLFRTDLLVHSLDNEVIGHVLNAAKSGQSVENHLEEFILLELYHRLHEDGLLSLMLEENPEIHNFTDKTRAFTKQQLAMGTIPKLFEYLQKRAEEVYSRKTVFHGNWITHAHMDHMTDFAVRSEVLRFLSPVTKQLLDNDFYLTSSMYTIAQSTIYRNAIGEKIGNSYPVSEFPYRLMSPGERYEIAPGFFVTGYEGTHSIDGVLGVVWEVTHKGKLVSSGAYGADMKDGKFYRGLQEHTKRYYPVQTVFTEATNSQSTQKKGAFTTERDVKRAFISTLDSINKEGAFVVVDIPKNNFVRACNLIHVALKSGKIPVVSPKILERLRSQIVLHNQSGVDIEAVEDVDRRKYLLQLRYIERMYDQGKIIIWKKRASNRKAYEKSFLKEASASADDLSQSIPRAGTIVNPYCLIREASESFSALSGISAEKKYWLVSMFAAYSQDARDQITNKERFAKEHGYIYLDKGFHTSGHGVVVSADHPQAEGGIAYELSRVNDGKGPQELMIVHSRNRQEVARDILPTYEGLSETIIYDHVNQHPVPILLPKGQFELHPIQKGSMREKILKGGRQRT